jgi:hypothetical protein
VDIMEQGLWSGVGKAIPGCVVRAERGVVGFPPCQCRCWNLLGVAMFAWYLHSLCSMWLNGEDGKKAKNQSWPLGLK